MAPRSTSFFRTGIPDQPLVQNAQTPFDGPERQVIDQQITDLQKALAAVLVNGVVGTYARIDAASPAISKGDVLCRSSSSKGTWTLATPDALAAAGGIPGGIALAAAAPNSRCAVATEGLIDPAITGVVVIAPAIYYARVSSAGRVEAVTFLSPGDAPLGRIDASQWLTLSMAPLQPGFVFDASVTTNDATPAVLLEIPFGPDAVMTGTLHVLAVCTSPAGVYQSFSAGGIIYTSSGTLNFGGSPTANTTSTFSPDSPSFTLNYDGPSQMLQIVGTGLAGANVRWKLRFDPLAFTS